MKIKIPLDPNSHHRVILEQMAAFIQMVNKLPTFRDH